MSFHCVIARQPGLTGHQWLLRCLSHRSGRCGRTASFLLDLPFPMVRIINYLPGHIIKHQPCHINYLPGNKHSILTKQPHTQHLLLLGFLCNLISHRQSYR